MLINWITPENHHNYIRTFGCTKSKNSCKFKLNKKRLTEANELKMLVYEMDFIMPVHTNEQTAGSPLLYINRRCRLVSDWISMSKFRAIEYEYPINLVLKIVSQFLHLAHLLASFRGFLLWKGSAHFESLEKDLHPVFCFKQIQITLLVILDA